MARYNEILVGRYARAVQKLFGIKGEVPVASLAGEMVVSHDVFNGAENRYLEGWDEYAAALNAVGGAAQFSGIRIRNPLASGAIFCISSIKVTAAVADNPKLSFNGATFTDLTTVSNASGVDNRQSRKSAAILSLTTNTVDLSAIIAQISYPANNYGEFVWTENQELPVLPGSAYQITSNVANQNLIVSLRWRERGLEESEAK
jgi:hypothetical protein